jgi:hypothetical protein
VHILLYAQELGVLTLGNISLDSTKTMRYKRAYCYYEQRGKAYAIALRAPTGRNASCTRRLSNALRWFC